ncbi:hypothetical protein [Kistimonas asteriae]|uniref:hypothetical protein n=1 Tax=Kistimonas asteriae TaxID=517724 RepID=UPI001BAC458A|nr:hypothetical protein [Kistimonas asteriae]
MTKETEQPMMSDTVPQPTGKRGRLQALFILMLPITLMILATWMYYSGAWLPTGRINNGALIMPPVNLNTMGVRDEGGNLLNAEALDGEWGMLVLAGSGCTESCANALYLSRQVHIALGRNATRMNRYLISDGLSLSDEQQREHPGLKILKADLAEVKKQLPESVMGDNPILLVDPLGNIMMHYGPDHTGKQMLKDLEKLLKASKIG